MNPTEHKKHRKIYLASSWRNEHYPHVLNELRKEGHLCHDFRDPAGHFRWSDIDINWLLWTPDLFKQKLGAPQAFKGFNRDMQGLDDADTCVLLLPCGRSAHLEAGYAIGQKKDVFILLMPEKFEPELMYRMVPKHRLSTNLVDLLAQLRR